MVQLVGQKTDLRRVGTRWSGLCPFHDERTPSFSVNPEEKLYYCFGCGEGGDAFKFVQQTEALDFQEAVELLAEQSGVRVEREADDPRAEERRRRRERLHALLERASRFYAAYLRESAEAAPAREYLASRGLSDEVLAEFRVGYSPERVGPDDHGRPAERLQRGGARGGRSGAAGQERRPLRPLSRADHVPAGRLARQGARLRRAADGGGARAEVPEHLRERPLPQGSPALRHRRGRKEAMRTARFVVVEGYTDVLALHQAGIREAVAIMGTALTQEQLAELAKVGDGNRRGLVYLALDADRAGRDAMLRASRLAEDRGIDLRVVEMPEGTDPAELVTQEGSEAFVRADGACGSHDRVSGAPGTCRCRPRHACRQG